MIKRINLRIKSSTIGQDGKYKCVTLHDISGDMITTRSDVQKGLDVILAHAFTITNGVEVNESSIGFTYTFPFELGYGESQRVGGFTYTFPFTIGYKQEQPISGNGKIPYVLPFVLG